MSILHIIRNSAFESDDFRLCIQNAKKDDSVLLMDDGCYNLCHSLWQLLENKVNNLYVIKEHAQARAVDSSNIKISTISIADIFPLTFQSKTVITWQ